MKDVYEARITTTPTTGLVGLFAYRGSDEGAMQIVRELRDGKYLIRYLDTGGADGAHLFVFEEKLLLEAELFADREAIIEHDRQEQKAAKASTA